MRWANVEGSAANRPSHSGGKRGPPRPPGRARFPSRKVMRCTLVGGRLVQIGRQRVQRSAPRASPAPRPARAASAQVQFFWFPLRRPATRDALRVPRSLRARLCVTVAVMTAPTAPEKPRNQRPGMQYRRFGRTNLPLSVITLGGMRYHDGWSPPPEQLPKRMIEQCAEMVRQALDAGINHIETAKGYGKSEHCYGRVLSELGVPRDRYYFMTKGAPETAEDTHRELEAQLKALRMDHIDLYAWHGINTPRRYAVAVAKGGPVEVLKRYQEQGVIGSVGFSTHGGVRTINDAIATDLFDFMNVHYYYFWQRNWGAVLQAAARDMGVFIISPNDKGGQLFNAPARLRELCAPLTPIQFNARFCLKTPHVHTLTLGM